MSQYKCEAHKLDIACLGCIKAWIARHDAMLEFIKQFIKDDWNNQYYMQNKAKKLLKEIGK